MPLLDDQDLKSMREWRQTCRYCAQEIGKNYCPQCDEFFYYWHSEMCPQYGREHETHRTY